MNGDLSKLYLQYVDQHDHSIDAPLDCNQFKYIVKLHYDYIWERLINGHEYVFPYFLGTVKIMKYKTLGMRKKVDFGETRKCGYTVYFTNAHTSGYRFRLYWTYRAKEYNLDYYSLRFVRARARQLAKAILDGGIDFEESPIYAKTMKRGLTRYLGH